MTKSKKKVGLVLGVFDFCHKGHINLLKAAKKQCDELIIGVHTDKYVEKHKGKMPSNSELERVLAIEELKIGDVVLLESDRDKLCKQYKVTHVFHGDDWEKETYKKLWGEQRIKKWGLKLVFLPHTPNINSEKIRLKNPPIGWWIHTPYKSWNRITVFEHIKEIYGKLGGTWIVSSHGRKLVKIHFPKAPCILIKDGQSKRKAAEIVSTFNLKTIVRAHFNNKDIIKGISKSNHIQNFIMLSHGRSGKPKTVAKHHKEYKKKSQPSGNNEFIGEKGNITIHNWLFAENNYQHFDQFIKDKKSFYNPIPKTQRPRIILMPTFPQKGRNWRTSLINKRWNKALKELTIKNEVLISPHPLSNEKRMKTLTENTNIKIIPPTGRSFELIPTAHCIITEISGVFWEALLFDTPTILAHASKKIDWPNFLAPTPKEILSKVPVVTPKNLVETVEKLIGKRCSYQHELGTARLGIIDGKASERIAKRINELSISNEKTLLN